MSSDPERYMKKLDTHFRLNLEYLKHLGRSFGFDYYVFYQPLGPLNLENPFIDNLEAYQKSRHYKATQSVVPLFRQHLKSNPISRFYDISDADSNCAQCYVDLTHYNPRLNATIARRILEQLDASEKVNIKDSS
ncbi:MAG: hypothetical protein F3739_07835 [Nitrospinae bacterium]|nr:hypothetical protein [Nitrospinota bacterium]